MTIYLDVIWALNFLFDTLLLYLTAIILKRKTQKYRLLLGGLIGSFIILLSITPLNAYSGHPITKLFFSFLMILAAFGYKRFRYFLSGVFTLYLVTFLAGGTLIGAHYFIQFDLNLASNVALGSIKGFGDPISWLFVLIGFPLAWHFSKTSIERIEVTKIQYDKIVDVSVKLGNVNMKIKGLIDNGNQLYDPISKMPVMFVSIKNLKDLPEEITKLANEAERIILGEVELESDLEFTLRIIPFKVVGQEHQLIIAVKPDEILIETGGERLLVEKGLVSFTTQELSSDDTFRCIVHPKMLTSSKSKTSTKVS
ncbi:sigma-E processing peptidase SpoIIGA [Robertmurraya massiliosenegalensis]|uniref:sigma-E processing peptidase SpoIIGA n=1 Tax=Robertmurraya TaxID=2837507 RepID=UPI0039A5F99C